MKTLKYIPCLFIPFLSLKGDVSYHLSEPSNAIDIQYTCRAAHDGFNLILRIYSAQLDSSLEFSLIKEAQQTAPTFVVDIDGAMKISSPLITKFDLVPINNNSKAHNTSSPRNEWNENIPFRKQFSRDATAFQTLMGNDFDYFAHNGEIAYKYDATKQNRLQYSDVKIVPQGWSAQVADAVIWRDKYNLLFERKSLTSEEASVIKRDAVSSNPIIRKMAIRLLLLRNSASPDDKMTWLKAEPTIVDVAVLAQLMLSVDDKIDVLTSPAWTIKVGEKLWGGTLIGAALLFTSNQQAVDYISIYRASMENSSLISQSDKPKLIKTAMAQAGYATIEGLGAELVKTNNLRNYPKSSAANFIFKVTEIIPPKLLSIEPIKK